VCSVEVFYMFYKAVRIDLIQMKNTVIIQRKVYGVLLKRKKNGLFLLLVWSVLK